MNRLEVKRRARARAGVAARWCDTRARRAGVEPRARSRSLLAAFFVAAGVNHFVMPRAYRAIVPPRCGDPAAVVAVSGVAEIVGGLAVLSPVTRRAAGAWLVALLVAVFPANIYMALRPELIASLRAPRPLLWLRLPLQPLMMWWAWTATRR